VELTRQYFGGQFFGRSFAHTAGDAHQAQG
jgi:hypothetical protein